MERPNSNKLMEIMRIKAGILINGVYFTDQALSLLHNENKLVSGTGLFNYNEIGSNKIRSLGVAPGELILIIYNVEIRIEVRSRLSFTQTPYSIDFKEGDGYTLYNTESNIPLPVTFPKAYSYQALKTKNNQSMNDVARLMGSSILRVYPDMRCDLAEIKTERCKFCNTFYGRPKLSDNKIIADITETLTKIKEEIPVRGIFMSAGYFHNKTRIIFFSRVLRAMRFIFPDINIVFSLAPQNNTETIKLLREAGGENLLLSFNLEVYDIDQWIPGKTSCFSESKAKIGRNYYFSTFSKAVAICGYGNIKSNFVLGLESLKSLSNGIKHLSQIGISSSGTVYYPTPGAIWTKLGYSPQTKDFIKSPAQFIINAYLLIAKAIIDYDLKIGWNQESRISGLEWDAFNYLTN